MDGSNSLSEKGMTGSKIAKEMLKQQWRPFGIPQTITSDQGPQFVAAWWSTMCEMLGIRQAYSQAYHHAANGRAEMAGQQLMERLRKLQAKNGINWVESLPNVLDRLHDVVGEGGLSPYQIVFGRDRPLANYPLPTTHECEDAENFMKRMHDID